MEKEVGDIALDGGKNLLNIFSERNVARGKFSCSNGKRMKNRSREEGGVVRRGADGFRVEL